MEFSAFFHGILWIAALTADSFVVSFAYGMEKIRIPFPLVIEMNLIMSSLLGAAFLAGDFFAALFPGELTSWLGTGLLLGIGLYRLGKFFWKKKPVKEKEKLKALSCFEGVVLAFLLSLDSLAVGVGTGLARSGGVFLIAGTFAGGVLMMEAGLGLGRRLRRSLKRDLSWISGLCLILLALGGAWK